MSDDTEARELLKAEYADMPYVAEGIDSGEIGTREIRAINNTLRQRDEARALALEDAARVVDFNVDGCERMAAEMKGLPEMSEYLAKAAILEGVAASILALANDKGDGR